MAEAVHF